MNLKNRLMDTVNRQIRRYIRFEICAVDKVYWHETKDDKDFNVCDVVMRDRRALSDPDFHYVRERLNSLQGMVGHCFGWPWNPRKGNLVKVLFYQNRKGLILGTVASRAEHPVCRPDPYTQRIKLCQWQKPYQDERKDFPRQPYPEGKKPVCLNWQHGEPLGETGPGRDVWMVFDYCHQGDEEPSCENCKNIDYCKREENHWWKFYSEETKSEEALPLRGEYHAPCGSCIRFESSDDGTDGITSKEYTEGKGFIRIMNATAEDEKKGHVDFHPDGSIEIQSSTNDSENETGTRAKVYAPDDPSGIAFEAVQLDTDASIRIYQDGKMTLQGVNSKLTFDGAQNKITMDCGANLEISASEKISLDAPLVEYAQDLKVKGNMEISGSCTCSSPPCPE